MSEAYKRYKAAAENLTDRKLQKELASMRRYLRRHDDRHFQEAARIA